MRIIATADVHLGMKFSSYPARGEELAEERFLALERVVCLGNERDADLLVVAGDLFNRVGVAARIVERAASLVDRFEGSAVLVLPGNHDYLAADGDRLWSAFALAAGDRTVVLDHAGPTDLDRYDLPLSVLAAPCDAQHSSSHRLGWATGFTRSPGRPVLGLAHGSVDGLTLDAEGHYFPMAPRLLGSLPADLWVVGHTHRYHEVRDARLVVPGTPEPDGFDCREVAGAAVIDLEADGSGYAVEHVPTGRFTFVDAAATIDDPRGETDESELERQVTRSLPDGDVVARISVDGTLADAVFERWNRVRRRLVADERVLRVDDDGLRRVLAQADVDRRYAQGSFAHRLLSRLVGEEDHEALAEALAVLEEQES